MVLIPPKQNPGRPNKEQAEARKEYADSVCATLLGIQPRLDFKVSARGWCYVLEGEGAISKGDFEIAEKVINDARKSGALPLDICAEDAKRETQGLESLDDGMDVKAYAGVLVNNFRTYAHADYRPFSFWRDLDVYVEIMVEKIDLVGLFSPICEEFSVPITNAGGSSDLNTRAKMMLRYKNWERQGKQCVLLYWTDLDPDGPHIAETFGKNLDDLSQAIVDGERIDWSPESLRIERVGLTDEQIKALGLTWIEGLETGSGKNLADPNHAHAMRDYVQEHRQKYGDRKCETNALLRMVPEARELCRESILRWISESAVEKYKEQLARERRKLKRAISARLKS